MKTRRLSVILEVGIVYGVLGIKNTGEFARARHWLLTFLRMKIGDSMA